jgi:hypothetical protein
MITWILNKLFRVEEIYGTGTQIHILRWIIGTFRRYKYYIHHFVGPDTSRGIHDHPKRFLTIGIAGSYTEEVRAKDGRITIRTWRAPWIRVFQPSYSHRIIAVDDAWTFVIVSPPIKSWGFYDPDGDYRIYPPTFGLTIYGGKLEDSGEIWSHTIEEGTELKRSPLTEHSSPMRKSMG